MLIWGRSNAAVLPEHDVVRADGPGSCVAEEVGNKTANTFAENTCKSPS
jgi:hypothetical protein